MEFLKELTQINEAKKKPLKKAAKAVYHRDYVRTKNKPYRKYHKDRTDEGVFDYVRGAGKYIGKKAYDKVAEKGKQLAEPFYKAHSAGKSSSLAADIKELTNAKTFLIQKLFEIGNEVGHDNVRKAINHQFASTKQINLANAIVKEYLAKTNVQTQTNEGAWDFLRGAGGAAGGAMKRAGRGIGQSVGHAARQIGDTVAGAAGEVGRNIKQAGQTINAAGQQASIRADLKKRIIQLGNVMLELNKKTRALNNLKQQMAHQR
ncbi:MAG: hypothetical protein ACXW2E_01890 [Nitrososphaeraceae archaeon]